MNVRLNRFNCWTETPHEREIRRLWHLVERLTLELQPEADRAELQKAFSMHDATDAWQWLHNLKTTVIKIAEHRLTVVASSWESSRALCPLCRCGDFAVPLGLSRHLNGEGKMIECGVIETFRNAALDYVRKP